MENKYALSEEILERNPQLKKRWWTRVLAGAVIMGVMMDEIDWRRFRHGYYLCPLLIAIFTNYLIFGDDLSLLEGMLSALLLTVFIMGFPFLHAMAFVYKHRHELGTKGGVKPELRPIA